jgi:hypothetical protein
MGTPGSLGGKAPSSLDAATSVQCRPPSVVEKRSLPWDPPPPSPVSSTKPWPTVRNAMAPLRPGAGEGARVSGQGWAWDRPVPALRLALSRGTTRQT